MRTVAAVRAGMPPDDAARSAGVHVRTVFKWLVTYNSGGQNALVGTKAPGAKPKLDPMQMMRLSRILRSDSPLQHRFEFALWTLAMIATLIQTQFGVRYSKTGVHKLMHNLGFTPQRPLYRAWQADPVLVERWQAQDLPALRKRAKKNNAQIFFADEAGVRLDSHFGRTWGIEGRTPVVKATGQRCGINVISAISPTGEMRFMLYEGRFTATVFIEFLERLVVGQTRPIYLVLDRHPVHLSKLVSAYADNLGERLELVFLPPYSPQLNPDEQVWGHLKARVAKSTPTSRSELTERVRAFLHRMQRLPKLVRSFFLHPECGFV